MRFGNVTISVLAVAGLLVVGCDGDGADESAVNDDAVEEQDESDPEDSGEQAAEPLASVVEVEPIEAPRSSAEIRVGELIIEFDGREVDEGTLLTLEEPILFDYDSADLKPDAEGPLNDVAEVLAFYEDAPVGVVGHTDDQGSRDYNLTLSSERAETVVDALTRRGISSGRISSEGRAFDEPVADNDTEEGRARNRRVEVLIEGVAPPELEDD